MMKMAFMLLPALALTFFLEVKSCQLIHFFVFFVAEFTVVGINMRTRSVALKFDSGYILNYEQLT